MAGPYFRRVGSGDGLPLVLLHGFGGNVRVWNRVFPLLKDEIPLIIADLPGHGKSLHSDGRGGAGRMAKVILSELEAQGVSEFHIAGHSMGGAVAALIAMRAPGKVKSLSLIAPGGMAPDINAPLLARFAKATEPDELKAVLSEMGGPALDLPDDYFTAVSEIRKNPGAVEALAETYAAMFPEGAEKGQGVLPKDQLEALAMPVSLIWGRRDAVLPCPDRAAVPSNFAFTQIDGAGHMLPEEKPAEVAAFLRAATSGNHS